MYLSNASNPTDMKWKQEKLMLAVKAMNNIEEILVNVMDRQPRWSCLLNAVDSRVDNMFVLVRSQALADHRGLLASLGWPPPLMTSNLDNGRRSEISNPLFLMQEDKKETFSLSFISLCALQHLQGRREVRRSSHLGHRVCLNNSLWVFEELVSPIASRVEPHFFKWLVRPKFIFALVYKITRDLIEGIEEVLQPLIDRERLVGYSAREAWVLGMVRMLSEFLKKQMFSVLAEDYHNKNGSAQLKSSWLHLVDLCISFDKQMETLVSSGNPAFQFQHSKGISLLSIFCDQPDWLEIWTELELKDAEEKLKPELYNEKAWVLDVRSCARDIQDTQNESFLLSTREEFKTPLVAGTATQIAWTLIERCQNLPNVLHQVQFIRSSTANFLQYFFDLLLWRHQLMERRTAYLDGDILIKIASLINAARYCESVLHEWSDNVSFLEMKVVENNSIGDTRSSINLQTSFFAIEINCLIKLETDWLEEIMTGLLREFNILSWNYVQNRNQWERDDSFNSVVVPEELTVSVEMVVALDTLKDHFQILKMALNSKDFLDLWRSIAGGLDHFIFSSIILSGVKFSKWGAYQFKADIRALFLVFQPFCTRPEAFFPVVSNTVKLLSLKQEDASHLLGILSKVQSKSECLQQHGMHHVHSDQAEKILKSRLW
ncbi:RINT1-like protein MAG2L isoform X2 [Aristolochia californica]